MIIGIKQKGNKIKKRSVPARISNENKNDTVNYEMAVNESHDVLVSDPRLVLWKESCPVSNSKILSRFGQLTISQKSNELVEDLQFISEIIREFSEEDLSDLMPNVSYEAGEALNMSPTFVEEGVVSSTSSQMDDEFGEEEESGEDESFEMI